MKARTYSEKRNPDVTSEPRFEVAEPTKGPLKFVIQRHEASHLHFDFRLECDGVLKSWAVPKGPSLDPSVRRTAIMVEDHPVAYADFEGQIPKGQYGGGEVILWDEGVYAPIAGTGERKSDEVIVRKELERGKLEIVLDGHRLKGAFVLIRTKVEENWLLIKMHDKFESKEDPTVEVDSVRSHLTAEDLRAGRTKPKVWPSNRTPRTGGDGDLGLMVPAERSAPFRSELWTFEPKVDGVRALAVKENGQVKLVTRNGNDIAERFPGITAEIRALAEPDLILDGELVLPGDDGRPAFQALMDVYHGHGKSASVRYYMFDLLSRNGEDLRSKPLSERRKQLEQLTLSGSLQLLPSIPTEGEHLYEEAIKMGFEGVVAKRLASVYRPGISDDWLKVKAYHSEEFLIGGWTLGTGARQETFGSLLLGRRDEAGRLRYMGNVGTGFDDRTLIEIRKRLTPLEIAKSPFEDEVPREKHTTFVKPDLLAEVRFAAWTRDGHLRMPSFVRLRPDRTAEDRSAPRIPTNPLNDDLLGSDEDDLSIKVEGHAISLTHLNKELWPGLTKRDLLRYLASVGETYLRYLRNRPLTFVRYPEGISGEGFFQRHWDKGLPEFVETVEIYSKSNGGVRRHTMCNNLATLIWLGQISALELHPWHSRADAEGDLSTDFKSVDALEDSALNRPDYLVCDLDPNIRSGQEAEGAEPEWNQLGWDRTVEVALGLKQMLDALRLRGFAKTTGKTGLHIYVPVERLYDSDQIKEAARTLGEHLMKIMPGKITMELRLNKRPSLVFFDANMNGFARTLASAYSPRPVPGGRVSMPLTWEQLPNARPEEFTITSVPALLAANGDAWSEMFETRNRLVTE
jgi:bifunctional non-homologous end joining protein LigD